MKSFILLSLFTMMSIKAYSQEITFIAQDQIADCYDYGHNMTAEEAAVAYRECALEILGYVPEQNSSDIPSTANQELEDILSLSANQHTEYYECRESGKDHQECMEFALQYN